MPIDFKASQIRTNKIIASGSDVKPYLLMYPSSSAIDQIGGISNFSNTGSDGWLFISGGINNDEKVVFGGDASVSGSFVVSPRLTDSLIYANVSSNPFLSRVGIKNNTPETTLHVGGTTDPGFIVDTGAIINYGRNNSSSATFLVQSKLGGDHGLLVVSGCCDRVSIGKHNPNAKLDVYGDGIYSGSLTVTGSLVARNITGSIQYVDPALTVPYMIGDGISYLSNTGQWQLSGDAFTRALQTPTWRGITSGSGQTEIFLDGGSKRYTIPIDSAQTYIVLASARQIGGSAGSIGDSRWFRIEGAIKNVSAVINSIGLNTTYDDGDIGTSSWDVSLEADGTNSALIVKVTGEVNKKIDWSIVAYPANNIARALTLDGQFNWYTTTYDSSPTEIFLDGLEKRFNVKYNSNHTFSMFCWAFSKKIETYESNDIATVNVSLNEFSLVDSLSNTIDFSTIDVQVGDFVEFANDGISYQVVAVNGIWLDVGTSVSPVSYNPFNIYRGSGESRWFKIDGGIKNVSGVTSLVGLTTVYDDGDSGASAWDVDVTADNTNDSLKITVTGENNIPIDWMVTAYITDTVQQTLNLPNDTIVWQGVTTGSGYVELFNGGMSKKFDVEESKAYAYQIIGHGFQTSGSVGSYGSTHWFRINGGIKNVTGSVELIGNNFIFDDSDPSASSWDLVLSADGINKSLKVDVVGEQNKKIEWFVKGYFTDISNIVGIGCGRPTGKGAYIQFNDGGIFGSDENFQWNKHTLTLTAKNITGSITNVLDGSPYIVGGTGIEVATASNGSITISYDGGVSSPGGNTYNVQFNDSGYFAGSDNFSFNNTTNYLLVSGTVEIAGNTTIGETSADLLVITASLNSNIIPALDSTYTLGTSTNRFAHVYTGDLHLRNERGDWTILEERDYLCVINNITGKKYKMSLTPLDEE